MVPRVARRDRQAGRREPDLLQGTAKLVDLDILEVEEAVLGVLLQKERRSLYSPTVTNPADDLLRISMSHGLPRCFHAVAELGIADALRESPRSAEELATDTRTHAGALARTLRPFG